MSLAVLHQFAGAGGALVAVILLMLALAVLARRLHLAPGAVAPQGAITLRGALALDTRRRLYLVEAGGHQALIITGGETDAILALPPHD